MWWLQETQNKKETLSTRTGMTGPPRLIGEGKRRREARSASKTVSEEGGVGVVGVVVVAAS